MQKAATLDLSLAAAGLFFFWSGVLAAFSFPVAAWLARHIGLVNTMVFTHIPANLCLIAAAFAPSLTVVLALLLLRAALSQMDVPTRTSYVMAVVTDDLPSVAQQVKQVQAATSGVSAARAQYWPTVDFTSARQLNLSGMAPYKQDTFSQVQMNMPLYSGGATSAGVRTAVGQLTAAQNGLEEARLLAREKAGLSYQEWVNAQGRAIQGESQARVGDKVVEGYRLQFRLARRQLLDLLNIQAEAFSYQSAATTAFYDEQIARARLLASMGDLAKRF